MTLPQAVASVFRQYVGFSGRARRSEYWFFVLFQVIALGAAKAVDVALGVNAVYLVVALALLLPALAVTVRRLHDTGRSGWMILLALIPLVGSIILIVFECQDSEPGVNKFGPSPKGVAAKVPAAPLAETPTEA